MIQEEPNSSNAIFIKALCLYNNGQFESARSHSQHVLRIDPDHVEAAKLIRVCPPRSLLLLLLLQVFFSILPDKGELKVAPSQRIKSLESLKNAGNDAYNAKRFQEAYDLYTQALEANSQNPTFDSIIYRNRAAALMEVPFPLFLLSFSLSLADVTNSWEGIWRPPRIAQSPSKSTRRIKNRS